MKTLLICLFCSAFQLISAQNFVEADHPYIRYMGRIDFSDNKSPTFSYSGISIKASFTGTSIGMKMENLSDENYYYMIIDHNPPNKLRVTKTASKYELAKGLKDTIHKIEIIKISECFVGRSIFKGFLLDEGKSLLSLPTETNKKILFIYL